MPKHLHHQQTHLYPEYLKTWNWNSRIQTVLFRCFYAFAHTHTHTCSSYYYYFFYSICTRIVIKIAIEYWFIEYLNWTLAAQHYCFVCFVSIQKINSSITVYASNIVIELKWIMKFCFCNVSLLHLHGNLMMLEIDESINAVVYPITAQNTNLFELEPNSRLTHMHTLKYELCICSLTRQRKNVLARSTECIWINETATLNHGFNEGF